MKYSYWKEQQKSLDWCERVPKLSPRLKPTVPRNTSLLRGTCDVNNTCICAAEGEKAKSLKADREAYSHLIRFKEAFNAVIFIKPNKSGNFLVVHIFCNLIFSISDQIRTNIRETFDRFQKSNEERTQK